MIKKIIDKYCIIGGGATGIGIGKCLHQANIPFDIIEQEDNFGGNWNYGKPCSKMYRSAHLISSKLITQFSDFPMPKHYPHYPSHSLMLEYLHSVATHYNLYEKTRFNTRVERIEPDNDYWKVYLSNQEEYSYLGVIVANGLLREPKYGNYPDNFTGMVLHSHEYTQIDIFNDKRVLVVGGGNSGCDIVVDATYSAQAVFHSTRRGYHYMPKFIEGKPTPDWQMEIAARFKDPAEYWKFVKKTFKTAGFDGTDYGLPVPDHEIYQCHPIMNSQLLYHIGHGNIISKPDIKSFKGNRVLFADGTEERIDIIVYATGYKTAFPFLEKKYLSWKENFPDLYAYSFHKEYDNLVFAGYVNSPSGLGNLINIYGKTLVSYLNALKKKTKAINIFNKIKQESNPELGNGVYIKSDRHFYEIDQWKMINLMNKLREKFENYA